MGNAIRWLKVQISAVDVGTPESLAKAGLCEAIDNYIQEKVILADQVIARKANEKIKDGDVVLTFAKSSIVQQTLLEAHRQGKNFRVIVVDSRPLFEGKNLVRALSGLGIKIQYSLIHGLSHVMRDATKVFLGAHAMMNTGKLSSRIGTALVAMMAKEHVVPVIVCCESIKFSDRSDLDSFVHNEIAPPEELVIGGPKPCPLLRWNDVPNLQLLNLMYDLTPAEYINVVFTEYGPIPPSSVPVIQRLSTET
jgi:translation initiation factor eIF-2B subunit delta